LGRVDYPSGEITWFVEDRFKRNERELELKDKLDEDSRKKLQEAVDKVEGQVLVVIKR
jgi:hypothetical protein